MADRNRELAAGHRHRSVAVVVVHWNEGYFVVSCVVERHMHQQGCTAGLERRLPGRREPSDAVALENVVVIVAVVVVVAAVVVVVVVVVVVEVDWWWAFESERC